MRYLAALALASTTYAAPAPLTSSVTRVAPETPVVVVPADAGRTTVERYRSHGKPVSGTPLVVIVRLADANSPDVVAVKDAHREGGKIAIAIATRKYDGPLAGNEVTTPYIEVALGQLPAGTYTIDIAEKILHFAKLDGAQAAGHPTPGLQSQITLTVQ